MCFCSGESPEEALTEGLTLQNFPLLQSNVLSDSHEAVLLGRGCTTAGGKGMEDQAGRRDLLGDLGNELNQPWGASSVWRRWMGSPGFINSVT